VSKEGQNTSCHEVFICYYGRSLSSNGGRGKRFISHRVDAAGCVKSAKANHNNIKLNPVFRGMLREKSRGFNQRKYCDKHWRKGIVGFWRSFRTPDEALEPQDEAVHL
jgi:hypothetical protein